MFKRPSPPSFTLTFTLTFTPTLTLLSLSLVLSGLMSSPLNASPAPQQTTLTEASALVEAQAVLKALKPAFKATLMGAMKAHGPVGAIDACATEAPKVPSALKVIQEARARGLELTAGRASHKLRNATLNAAPDWLTPQLEVAKTSHAEAPVKPQLTPIKGAQGEVVGYGYAEPIYLLPPCLACHGEQLAPAIENKLTELYPRDEAIGFKLGEFRGFFYAEVKALGSAREPKGKTEGGE